MRRFSRSQGLKLPDSMKAVTGFGMPPTSMYSLKSRVASWWMAFGKGVMSCRDRLVSSASMLLFCAQRYSSKSRGFKRTLSTSDGVTMSFEFFRMDMSDPVSR